jgi:aminopeptidase-like protein
MPSVLPSFADFYHPLHHLPRSCTGLGVVKTLQFVQSILPVTVHNYPSGQPVFDWTLPQEWNFRAATLATTRGDLVVDSTNCILHTLIHSAPFKGRLSQEQLFANLHTRADMPDAIPYRTSYYSPRWGLCMSENAKLNLKHDEYDVHIDADLFDGSLTLGELLIPGTTPDEFVLSCHICHPHMANDNLSGLYLAVRIFSWLSSRQNRLSYRLILAPGTIGAICWLFHNQHLATTRIKHGLIATCVGDSGPLHYKQSRDGNATIDQVALATLRQLRLPHRVLPWSPYGYDERQYNSPGFNLNFGVLSRSPNGGYPQYHTSLDDLSIINTGALEESIKLYQTLIETIDAMPEAKTSESIRQPQGKVYKSTNPFCEPMLGKRGLYKTTGGAIHSPTRELALLWVMNLADAHHGIDDIIAKSQLDRATIEEAVNALSNVGLLE